MPFSFGNTFNDFTDAILRAPVALSIARNPIYTALILSVFAAIILFIFISSATLRSTMRFAFWFFICAVSIMFLHNKILLTDKETDIKNENYKHIFNTPENYGTLKDFNQSVGQARINTQIPDNIFNYNITH
jgi:hypothetical protein